MNSTRGFSVVLLSVSLWFTSISSAEPLPGTKPLTEDGDLARKMVDGIHVYLDRELAASPAKRDGVKPDRDRLRQLLGVVDDRVPPRLEVISPLFGTTLVGESGGCKISRVRWAVLPGVDAEGLAIRCANGKPVARIVAVPHAGQTPDEIAGLKPGDDFALRLARNGCDVLIPTLLDRSDTFSANPKLGRQTNLPHREFVYRMAYEMGRTPVGYEVQMVLAAADAWVRPGEKNGPPLGVIGFGDGGRVALYAAALDERFQLCQVAGAFGPQESLWRKPIDRNVWGLLSAFGDAEVGGLIAPRKVIIDATPSPRWDGPASPKPGRGGAAPGELKPVSQSDFTREFERLKARAGGAATRASSMDGKVNTHAFLTSLGVTKPVSAEAVTRNTPGQTLTDPPEVVQQRQLGQLVAFTQKLWRDSDAARKSFWAKAKATPTSDWERLCNEYRRNFHLEVIGKLPDATLPPSPRTRVIYDEPKWKGYEVALDLHPDVFAYGILLLPKGLKPGEKRPVVVCQHGLEGRPTDVTNPKEVSKYYNSFGARLADLGYIVYAPQNPYIFQNHFRQVQRKANPLGLSLFSFIIAQHKTTLDWLESLPNVDAKRIGFYGLSYGGKTAMRVPAVEKRYALSICAGDFNEWVGKNVSVDLDRSYLWTGEYEMYEFNLGHTFNYAEMAYLIAPRPFMVERGHDDGVGTDEMVAYEYAKVRYLYANKLNVPDRTAIEFRPGGHEIFLKGTRAFLEQHLGKP